MREESALTPHDKMETNPMSECCHGNRAHSVPTLQGAGAANAPTTAPSCDKQFHISNALRAVCVYVSVCILRVCIWCVCILRVCIMRVCILRVCILRVCILRV